MSRYGGDSWSSIFTISPTNVPIVPQNDIEGRGRETLLGKRGEEKRAVYEDELELSSYQTKDRYIKFSFVVLLAVLAVYGLFMLPDSPKTVARMEMKKRSDIQERAAAMRTVFKGDKWPGILGFLKPEHKISREEFDSFTLHQPKCIQQIPFDTVDVDNDATIDLQEFQNYLNAHKSTDLLAALYPLSDSSSS